MTHNAVKGAFADYHVHTPYCGHAKGRIADYVENAINAGLPGICLTDHLGRYYLTKTQKRRYWDWGMSEKKLDRYISECKNVAEIHEGEIAVRTGLEIDYIEGAEELLESIISPYPLDFLLGSIHCLPGLSWKHLSNFSQKDTWPVYEEYFNMFCAAAESRMFDSISHIDFIWRYVRWPENKTGKIYEMIDNAVKCAVGADVAVEINSNGYLWSRLYKVDEGDPFDVLLESIKKHGANITIGSDAHKPEFVGKSFDGISEALTEHGIRQYCTFLGRNRTAVLIS